MSVSRGTTGDSSIRGSAPDASGNAPGHAWRMTHHRRGSPPESSGRSTEFTVPTASSRGLRLLPESVDLGVPIRAVALLEAARGGGSATGRVQLGSPGPAEASEGSGRSGRAEVRDGYARATGGRTPAAPGWNLCGHLRCEHGGFVADESGAGVPRRGGPVLTTGPLGGPQEKRPIPPPVFAGRTGAGSHGGSGRLRSDRRDCGRGRWFPPGPLNPGSLAGVRGGIGGRP